MRSHLLESPAPAEVAEAHRWQQQQLKIRNFGDTKAFSLKLIEVGFKGSEQQMRLFLPLTSKCRFFSHKFLFHKTFYFLALKDFKTLLQLFLGGGSSFLLFCQQIERRFLRENQSWLKGLLGGGAAAAASPALTSGQLHQIPLKRFFLGMGQSQWNKFPLGRRLTAPLCRCCCLRLSPLRSLWNIFWGSFDTSRYTCKSEIAAQKTLKQLRLS